MVGILLDCRIPQTYTVITILSSFLFILCWAKERLKNYSFNGKNTLLSATPPSQRSEPFCSFSGSHSGLL